MAYCSSRPDERRDACAWFAVDIIPIRSRASAPSRQCLVLVDFFMAELFNEYAALRGQAQGEATLNASLHDLSNTMFWPTVILVLGRFLFPRKKSEKVLDSAQSSDLVDQPLEQAATV